MTRRGLFTLASSLLLCSRLPAIAQRNSCATIEAKVEDQKFKPGQVWDYQTRPGESASTITILQIDRLDKIGVVVHARVDGLKAHNLRRDLVPSVEHMPFTRDAMLLSVVHLVRTEKVLPTLEGYNEWRSRCGGVYTISVADAVAGMEKTFNQGTAN